MIVVDHGVDKRSPVILHESKSDHSRKEGGADGESAVESDTSFEEQSCKSVFQNRKSVLANDSSSVPPSADNRISVAKHDSEPCRWKVTTDKGNNTGIVRDSVKAIFLKSQIIE